MMPQTQMSSDTDMMPHTKTKRLREQIMAATAIDVSGDWWGWSGLMFVLEFVCIAWNWCVGCRVQGRVYKGFTGIRVHRMELV